jgi:hypothetical protein
VQEGKGLIMAVPQFTWQMMGGILRFLNRGDSTVPL